MKHRILLEILGASLESETHRNNKWLERQFITPQTLAMSITMSKK
jgi:hypothetical protein